MTDNELRGILLKKYYKKRCDDFITLKPSDLDAPITQEEIIRISTQLEEHRLIYLSETVPLMGPKAWRISAFGIDVVENEGIGSPIKITFDQSSHHYLVHDSSNVQIGTGNIQDNSINLTQIIDAINNSSATPEQKQEMKSKLAEFFRHPLVTTFIGQVAATASRLLMPNTPG